MKEDRFTTIHIQELTCIARDTKLGSEEISSDIPNVGEGALGQAGRVGHCVYRCRGRGRRHPGGQGNAQGRNPADAGRKAAACNFGEKASDVKDTSLRVPSSTKGTVIDVQVFTRDGLEKDARAMQIEKHQLDEYRKDLKEEYRILKRQRLPAWATC